MWVSFIMRKIAIRGDLNHLHRVVLPGLCLKMKLLIAQSCPTPWDPMNYSPPGSSVHGILQAWRIFKNTGMGGHSVLQGIFLTQGLNLGLLHCRQIFYHLSHQGSPVLVYLCAIILFSFSHLSCPKTLPNMLVQLFPKMDSTAQTCGSLGITCHGAATPPFCTLFAVREVSLILGNFCMLSLYSSKAQLLPLALSLESLRENKASVVLQLTNTSCPAQESIYFLHQF